MCGIIAVLGNELFSPEQLSASLLKMKHRGPDASGEWMDSSSGVMLGHARLSINDLSEAGMQPMKSVDGRLLLVCNGEIYNYYNLREELEAKGAKFTSNSDSEVILHAYKAWNTAAFDKLEGMFAFVLWDAEQKMLFAVRDGLGVKPLYYSVSSAGIIVASELSAILPHFKIKPELDRHAICQLLSICHVPPPRSIYKNISKLEPGHYLSYSLNRELHVHSYWEAPKSETLGEGVEQWSKLFDEVVREQMLSDVDVGLFLSGGIDSSSIAVAAAGNNKPTGLTLSFPDSELNESDIARGTAEKLNMPIVSAPSKIDDVDALITEVASVMDEPVLFSSTLAAYEISRVAAEKGFKVVLTGSGGDECFAGYSWHQWRDRKSMGPIDSLAVLAAKVLGKIVPDNFISRWMSSHITKDRHLDAYITKSCSRASYRRAARWAGYADYDYNMWRAPFLRHYEGNDLPLSKKLQRTDLMTFCSAINLQLLDKTSMRHSLEARVPFLDRRVVSWALRNRTIGLDEGPAKKILRDYIRSSVDPRVLTIEKRGFRILDFDRVDTDSWVDEIMESHLIKDGVIKVSRKELRKVTDRFSLIFLSRWYDKNRN